MAFEDPTNDPLATPSNAVEKTPHAGGIEDPTVEYGSTSLDEATKIHKLDDKENIPRSLDDSLVPITAEEQEAARRAVEAVRNKSDKKPSKIKKILALVGLGAVVGGGVGAAVVAASGSDNETTPTNTPAATGPAVPGTIAPETVVPTSIEQGATSVTITTPSAEVTTSAPVVGEVVPGADKVAIEQTRGIIETKFGQSFAPESLLAAANSIDINNLEGKSAFGIQEMPYTDITTPEQATEVYNQYVVKEGSRIINLLVQSRGLESNVPVPQKFSGLTPSENFSVEDLILIDAAKNFGIRDVNEVAIINGVPGNPDGILQHFKTIADGLNTNEWVQINEVLPEQYREQGDAHPVITGVTPTEAAGNETGKPNMPGVKLTLADGDIEYKIQELLTNPDNGSVSTLPSRGFLLKGEEGLALYKGNDGNVRVELTDYSAYTQGTN